MRSDFTMGALWMAVDSIIFCGAIMIGFQHISQEQEMVKALGKSMQVHETSTVIHGKSEAWNKWNGSEYEQTFSDNSTQEVLSIIYKSQIPISINGNKIPDIDLENYRKCNSDNFKKYIPTGIYRSELSFDTNGNCTSINFVQI